MGKNSRALVPLVDDLFNVEPDEKLLAMEALANIYYPHPDEPEIKRGIRELVKYGMIGKRAGRPARSMYLVGESGGGKSCLLKQLENQYPRYVENRRPVIRVLRVECPAVNTVKGLNAAINMAMELPSYLAMEGNAVVQTADMFDRMRDYRVGLLILDEVQHLFKDGKKLKADMSNHLKELLNNRVCPVLVAGTARTLDVFDLFADQRRRSKGVFYLEAMDWNDPEQRDFYIDFIDTYEKAMPFKVKPKLWLKKNAIKLYVFTGGLIGLTADVIVEAAIRCIEGGEETLTEDSLRIVVNRMKRQRRLPQPNPYNPGAQLIPIKAEIREQQTIKSWKGNRKIRQKDLLG
jgi:hypothetical protein